ncbi:MAG: response regulator transcription factor [Tissierellia bacterium]|nr:response regulator transcription factor [Tissierellia bacterium]
MKILLIEDHKMFATSLKESLEKMDGVEVDLVFSEEEIYTKLSRNIYDIVMVDINLTGLFTNKNGLEISREIMDTFPSTKIVILTGYNLEYYEEVAKDIGCWGFISKEEDSKSLMKKLEAVAFHDKKFFYKKKTTCEKLTIAEKKIVRLYAGGKSRKEVAEECEMSLRSLTVSLNRIYEKLQVMNYQQMTDKARELGYVDPF